MKTKKSINLLIGSLLIAGLVIGIGIVMAHGNGNKDNNEAEVMHSNMDEMMENMMGNESSMTEMYEMMEEMMNDDEMREEMLEHMEICPNIKNNHQYK